MQPHGEAGLLKNIVLLDTARPDKSGRRSYLFRNPLEILSTGRLSEVPPLLERAGRLAEKHWLAGYICYEAGYALEERFRSTLDIPDQPLPGADLIWLGVFGPPEKPDAFRLTASEPGDTRARLSFSLTEPGYAARVRRIRDLIAEGHTYQVNLTFDARYSSPLSAEALYASLRQRQPTPYCAFIRTEKREVLSFSPELFFRVDRGRISVKPMKGTAPRGFSETQDQEIGRALAQDPKNRAENLMIVDLLRNDLGRVCKTGSVRTTRLFEIEKHPSLFQMTSTVEGRLKPGTGFQDIIRNIFPSGSVTGAPKIRTMEIIRSLEKGGRGVYCGAIGFTSPSGKAVFNVPIRTLQRKTGQKAWQYRVGSGIVWDSTAESEWEECRVKCSFLAMEGSKDFEILESLLFDQGPLYARDHLERMRRSALRLGFAFSPAAFCATLKAMRFRTPQKVRILLSRNGRLHGEAAPMAVSKAPESNLLFVSKAPIDKNNLFLYHKTTRRSWYDGAMEKIKQGHCCDVAFFNKQGELTEGARTNIFVRLKGRLYTPPVECGLLPGVLRERLIRAGKCFEKILTMKDLEKADAIYAGNSVRGLKRVVLSPAGD